MTQRPKCPNCGNSLQRIQEFQSTAFPRAKPFYRMVCICCEYTDNLTFNLINGDELKTERDFEKSIQDANR